MKAMDHEVRPHLPRYIYIYYIIFSIQYSNIIMRAMDYKVRAHLPIYTYLCVRARMGDYEVPACLSSQ